MLERRILSTSINTLAGNLSLESVAFEATVLDSKEENPLSLVHVGPGFVGLEMSVV